MTELLLLLLLAHVVGDFYLQPQAWIDSRYREKIRSLGLLKHIGVHLLLTALVLSAVSYTTISAPGWSWISAWLAIVLSHYAIDIWKSYQRGGLRFFLIDQVAHIVVLVGVSVGIASVGTSMSEGLSTAALTWFTIPTFELSVVLGYLTLATPLNVTISMAIAARWQPLPWTAGLSQAGAYTGIGERWLLFSLGLFDYWYLVATLVGAKLIIYSARRPTNARHKKQQLLGSLISTVSAIVAALMFNPNSAI